MECTGAMDCVDKQLGCVRVCLCLQWNTEDEVENTLRKEYEKRYGRSLITGTWYAAEPFGSTECEHVFQASIAFPPLVGLQV